MTGLLIGDMGPKTGYQTLDNGFIRFNNYRVPKEALLNQFF
jgi:acyl-CoA oxidase